MSAVSGAIDVVYADPGGGFVVVDKPSGLLSVPGKGAETDPAKADCVVARVRGMYPGASGPMTVHRLDMETSGLMVVALTAGAQRALSVAFQDRSVEKRYEAVLVGGGDGVEMCAGDAGAIVEPMRADIGDRPRQVRDVFQGKRAETRWRCIGVEAGGRVRLEMEPVTGRSHQLRVHAALDVGRGGLGRVIVGDALYGGGVGEAREDGGVERTARVAAAGGRLLLHATRLVLPGGLVVERGAPF